MKRLLQSLCVLLFIAGSAMAQDRTVVGKVISGDDNLPIPGVSVMVANTKIGAITDANGMYSIKVPTTGNSLTFSYIGYQKQTVSVSGKTSLNVTLRPDSKQLSEVIVTANGIKREKRTLGYSAPTVDNAELTQGGSPSVLTSLTGRVAGVNITSTSGTPGGSTRIVLRGGSSISGNNQALIVVDGLPIDNSSITGGANSLVAVDYGNRGNDIDPNDVASVTVLKGPAAAALYGSRASNGAIMITTKSGSNRSKKTEVTFNSTNTFSSILRVPDWQNEYGQGFLQASADRSTAQYTTGIADGSDNFSWGGPFTGKTEPWGQTINGVAQTKPYAALPNNIKDFFTTGFATANNAGISSGNDKSSFYLSLNSLNSNGIYPGNKDTYDKYGVRFNGKTTLANNLTASVSFDYSKIMSSNIAGGQGSNGVYQNLLQTPRDIPINKAGDLNNPYNAYGFTDAKGVVRTGEYGFYNAFAPNPYFIIKNYSNVDDVNRITGNFNLEYKPVSWLNIVERVGVDSYSDRRRGLSPKFTFTAADNSDNSTLWTGAGNITNNGSYEIDQYNTNEVVHDLMVTATHKFTDDLQGSILLGNNIRQRSTTSSLISTNTSGGLIVPGLYNLQNSNGPLASLLDQIAIRRLVGFYADANLSYKNYLFLEGTVRNDRSSTLPLTSYSYWYPSVSGSFVFSELLKKSAIGNVLSYGKIRSSYAQVGSDTDPYRLLTTYNATAVNSNFGSTLFPFGSVSALEVGSTLGNNKLKPEQTSSFEIGTELAFFNSRLSFDFSYYANLSKNQILSIPIPNSTGYGFKTLNAGEIQNKGIELSISGTPIKTSYGLTWDLFGTFTKNNSNVVSLQDGVSQISIGGFGGMGIVAAKGLPYGEFYAVTNSKDAQGRTIISKTTGLPILTDKPEYLGSYNPKYMASLGTSLKYKGFDVTVLFDVKHGGVLYSQTKQLVDFVGTAAETGGPRVGQVFPNSVYLDASGKSVPNTNIFYSKYDYFTAENSPGQEVIDASYVKMRSASIAYSFRKSQLNSLPFGAITIGLFGNNLFLWTPKANRYVDPEVNSSGSGNEQGLDFAANPSVRNYGINLKVSF